MLREVSLQQNIALVLASLSLSLPTKLFPILSNPTFAAALHGQNRTKLLILYIPYHGKLHDHSIPKSGNYPYFHIALTPYIHSTVVLSSQSPFKHIPNLSILFPSPLSIWSNYHYLLDERLQ